MWLNGSAETDQMLLCGHPPEVGFQTDILNARDVPAFLFVPGEHFGVIGPVLISVCHLTIVAGVIQHRAHAHLVIEPPVPVKGSKRIAPVDLHG